MLPLSLFISNRSVVIILAILTLSAVFDQIRYRRGWSGIDRFFLTTLVAFLGWGALGLAWEHTQGMVLQKVSQLTLLCGGGLITWMAVEGLESEESNRVFHALKLGLLVCFAIMGLEWLSNMAITRFMHGLGKDSPPAVTLQVYKTGATTCVLLTLVVVSWWRGRAAWLPRAGFMGAALATTLITGSLSGLVAICAALGVAALGRLSSRLAIASVLAALIVANAVTPLAHHLPPPEKLQSSMPWLPNSAIHRTLIWHFGAERWLDHPFLGWGLDASRDLPGAEHPIAVHDPKTGSTMNLDVMPLHPHNNFVQVWLETGVVGALLYLVLAMTILRLIVRRSAAEQISFCQLMIATLVISSISFGAWQSWWIAFCWLVAGLARAGGVGMIVNRPGMRLEQGAP